MDIKFSEGDYRFLYRTSAVIFNKDKSKVLLFNVEGRSFYLLPGGKVNQKEDSMDAIKREVKEELGYENIIFSLLAISEESVIDKGFYNQQLNIIYKGIYTDDIKEDRFKGIEGEWINFEWVNVCDIDSYNVYPSAIKEALKMPDSVYHFVENLAK